MSVILTYIRIQNIGPYKDTKCDFTSGKTAIIGENGSGKTMLLKCINMGLWGGKSQYILNTNLDNFIRRGEESGSIVLKFTVNEMECTVERVWYRNSSNEAILKTPVGKFKGITNVDEEMERLFGTPSKNWIDISWARQGEINELLEGDKDVFDRLLGIADLENAWLRMRDTLSSINSDKNAEERVIEELENSIKDEDEITAKISDLREEIKQKQIELDGIDFDESRKDNSDQIAELKTVRKTKQKKADKLENVLEQGDVCPTCKQEINENHKKHLRDDITDLMNDIDGINSQLKDLKVQQSEFLDQKEKNRQKELKKTKLQSDIENKYELITALQNQMDKIEERKRRLREHKQNYEKIKTELEHAEMIRNAFRISQPYLREGRINKLRYGVSEFFEEMFGNRFSRFEIDNDYTMTIWENGFVRNTSTLSGGESVALGIALRLSIVREIGNQDLLILDEPTSHLDDERITQLIDVIEKISTDNQIFIVTHEELMNSVCDNVITIQRETGSSIIHNLEL